MRHLQGKVAGLNLCISRIDMKIYCPFYIIYQFIEVFLIFLFHYIIQNSNTTEMRIFLYPKYFTNKYFAESSLVN